MEAFHDAARQAAHVVAALPRGSRLFLHCDADADGLCAATVAAVALRRAGYQYQVRASREKDEATYEALGQLEFDALIVLDKGTSHVHVLGEIHKQSGKPIIVLDHHNVLHDEVPEGIHMVNPRMVGLDGSHDACSSTSAVAFAKALDQRNSDLGPIGLVGAIGDWQHQGGWRGWNGELVDEGLEHGHLDKRPQLSFIGMNLAEALARGGRVQIPGLNGDLVACRKFLSDLAIPVELDNESLDHEQETRLLSALALHCAAAGWSVKQIEELVHPELTSTKHRMGLRRMFRMVDACGRLGKPATGLALLLGDPAATAEAEETFGEYRATIAQDLSRLTSDGPTASRFHQSFEIEMAPMTGMVAGIGMTHVVADRSKPLVVWAPRDDGLIQVSTRGLESQVEAGMDLGEACRRAAAGASGGGHPIAAGAVVDAVAPFLAQLELELEKQKFLEKT